MTSQIMQVSGGELLESVVIGGDLKNLSPAERVQYYKAVCDSLGINYLTRPFEYMTLNGKLTLYARKDATDQLRDKRGISVVGKPAISYQDDWIIVTVMVSSKDGRYDGFFPAFEALEDEYYEALAAKAEVYERENAAPVAVRTEAEILKELGY